MIVVVFGGGDGEVSVVDDESHIHIIYIYTFNFLHRIPAKRKQEFVVQCVLRYAEPPGAGADPGGTSVTRVVTEKIHSKVRRCLSRRGSTPTSIEGTNPVGHVRASSSPPTHVPSPSTPTTTTTTTTTDDHAGARAAGGLGGEARGGRHPAAGALGR